MTVFKVSQSDCKHKFVIKGDVGFCCRECIKCGYFEVM